MTITKLGFPSYESGEEYLVQLNDEANRNFQVFKVLLSSYFQSSIDGPNYARHLQSISIEFARLRIALEQIRTDTDWTSTRTEYLYQVLTSILFPGEAADLGSGDLEFRTFLTELVKLYFKGSIPEALLKAVELLTNGAEVKLTENFIAGMDPGSGFDISDQFGFQIDVFLTSPSQIDVFRLDKNVRILMYIMRPAHTLYKLRLILRDNYTGNQTADGRHPFKVLDALRWELSDYKYEDFRKFVLGVKGINKLGSKFSKHVIQENHSSDW